jgi:hypothetical protein
MSGPMRRGRCRDRVVSGAAAVSRAWPISTPTDHLPADLDPKADSRTACAELRTRVPMRGGVIRHSRGCLDDVVGAFGWRRRKPDWERLLDAVQLSMGDDAAAEAVQHDEGVVAALAGRAGATPRSSSTPTPAGSWAGRSRRSGPANWCSMLSSRRSGPGTVTARTWPGWSLITIAAASTSRWPHAEHLAVAWITPSTRGRRLVLRQRAGRVGDRALQGRPIRTRRPRECLADLEIAAAEWVDWINHRRAFGDCDDLTPVEAEQAHYAHHQDPATAGTSNWKVPGLPGAAHCSGFAADRRSRQ